MDLRQQQRSRTAVRPAATRPAVAQNQSQLPVSLPERREIPRFWWFILGGLIALATLAYIAVSVFGIGSPIDRSKYQAVFLTNGQVFFGKLSGWGSTRPILNDVYYFQATGNTDAKQDEQAEAISPTNGTQTLIKLGDEVHRPVDKLILNSDAILFVENIEDDGQVMEAIKKNKED